VQKIFDARRDASAMSFAGEIRRRRRKLYGRARLTIEIGGARERLI